MGKATPPKSRTKLAKVSKFDPKSVGTFEDLPEAQPIEFIGLISPDGNPGGSSDGRKNWTFSTNVCAWKAKGGPTVREPALIVCRKISEQKLSSLMRRVSNLDIVEFVAERPRKSDRPKSYPKQQRFELIRFGKTVRARDLQDIRDELKKPVVVKDAVFGNLELSRRHSQFTGKASFRRTEMIVSFETTCPQELREIIASSRSLWRNRQMWFSSWRKKVYQYYMKTMTHWWSGDGELTEKRFYDLLGWPVGVDFFIQDGKFGYQLSGWCEELFTDHGIDAYGTSVRDMAVSF